MSYFKLQLKVLSNYFSALAVGFHDSLAVLGFFIFLTIGIQLITGIMLALSLIPEPMIIPIVRDEEDLEDLYIEDFFWMHERGIDLIFIFSYIHLLRKIYLFLFDYEQEAAWKSGFFVFLILQVTVFCGLVLCCTHLSEITLTIAANILHTFFAFKGKAYWWFFTDKQLNSDTIIRLAYGHYISAFFVFLLAIIHGIDLHYDWKSEAAYDGIELELTWWDEAFLNEISKYISSVLIFILITSCLYSEPEALSYEIFMWGDIGLMTDVRYYGVAPHWYFRPFMAWLIVCPYHNLGVAGLLYFFFILFYQPNIHGITDQLSYMSNSLTSISMLLKRQTFYIMKYTQPEFSISYQQMYGFFFICLMYTTTFLPYGRFYNRLGGNNGFLAAYFFVFVYLGLPWIRKNFLKIATFTVK